MNPKDMTHVELLSEAMASMLDIGACYEGLEQERADSDVIRVELLRRLDEADALRKENEELRNLLGECPKRNNRLGTYSDAKPVQIDVCKLICMTKESEASHES